ncbi:RGCVC family protein [Rhodococcus aerolatus]
MSGDVPGEACAACRHPLAEHDDLGRRFCAATEAGALPRACICRT